MKHHTLLIGPHIDAAFIEVLGVKPLPQKTVKTTCGIRVPVDQISHDDYDCPACQTENRELRELAAELISNGLFGESLETLLPIQ